MRKDFLFRNVMFPRSYFRDDCVVAKGCEYFRVQARTGRDGLLDIGLIVVSVTSIGVFTNVNSRQVRSVDIRPNLSRFIMCEGVVSSNEFRRSTKQRAMLFRCEGSTIGNSIRESLTIVRGPMEFSRRFLKKRYGNRRTRVDTSISSGKRVLTVFVFRDGPSFRQLLRSILLGQCSAT